MNAGIPNLKPNPNVQGATPVANRPAAQAKGDLSTGAASFQDALAANLQAPKAIAKNLATTNASGLKFSNHAIERMQSRGIQMNSEMMQKLNQAYEKANAKGAKDTLVLMGDTAMIMSVKNKTIVTALDAKLMKDNVFTNIDSTVII